MICAGIQKGSSKSIQEFSLGLAELMEFWVLMVCRIISFYFNQSEDRHNTYLGNVGKKHIILHDLIIQKTTTEEAVPSQTKTKCILNLCQYFIFQ